MKKVWAKSLGSVSDRRLMPSRKNANRSRAAFSLIELLTVVVIILILTGVLYRVSGYVTQRAGRARTAYELELLRNALDEYYAVYGHYPPTSGTSFTDKWNVTGKNRYPGSWGYYEEQFPGQMPTQKDIEWDKLGLAFYLQEQFTASDDSPGQAPEAERNAYENRWKHYLDELTVVTDSLLQRGTDLGLPGEVGTLPHSNRYVNIRDPYGRSWVYERVPSDSDRPQAYILYSMGPDGKKDTDDDIGRDRWTD